MTQLHSQPFFTRWEREMLQPFLAMGGVLARIAEELQATYLTVHMPMAGGALVGFTHERGAVWVTGHGFDVELSASPPGAAGIWRSSQRTPSCCGTKGTRRGSGR
jgi:hypothetical protein